MKPKSWGADNFSTLPLNICDTLSHLYVPYKKKKQTSFDIIFTKRHANSSNCCQKNKRVHRKSFQTSLFVFNCSSHA